MFIVVMGVGHGANDESGIELLRRMQPDFLPDGFFAAYDACIAGQSRQEALNPGLGAKLNRAAFDMQMLASDTATKRMRALPTGRAATPGELNSVAQKFPDASAKPKPMNPGEEFLAYRNWKPPQKPLEPLTPAQLVEFKQMLAEISPNAEFEKEYRANPYLAERMSLAEYIESRKLDARCEQALQPGSDWLTAPAQTVAKPAQPPKPPVVPPLGVGSEEFLSPKES